MRDHPERLPVPGVLVVRTDAPLFWSNATAIEDRLLGELERWSGARALVLDLEAMTRLDTTSADVLVHLVDELRKRDTSLYLARVLHPVSSVLERSGVLSLLGEDRIWHSISQCVRAARRDTGLKGKHAAKVHPGDDGDEPLDAAGVSDGEHRRPPADEVEVLEEGDDDFDVTA